MAQSDSASVLGTEGRRFKSCYVDLWLNLKYATWAFREPTWLSRDMCQVEKGKIREVTARRD